MKKYVTSKVFCTSKINILEILYIYAVKEIYHNARAQIHE